MTSGQAKLAQSGDAYATVPRGGKIWLIPVDLVIDVDNTPGALAKVAAAISDHLVYVATGNRVVFGSPDLESLNSALAASG